MSCGNRAIRNTWANFAFRWTCDQFKLSLEVLNWRRRGLFENFLAVDEYFVYIFLKSLFFVSSRNIHRVWVGYWPAWWLWLLFTLIRFHIHEHFNALLNQVNKLISVYFGEFLLFKLKKLFIICVDFVIVPNLDWQIKLENGLAKIFVIFLQRLTLHLFLNMSKEREVAFWLRLRSIWEGFERS